MGAKKRLLQIKEAFQMAQKPHQNHAKLVVGLKSTYDQLEDKGDFHEKFIHFLKYAMIIYRREPAVEQVINFVAKFVTCFYEMEKMDGSEEEEEEDLLLNYVFNFLLESHNANSHAVRFRTCQLINKILGNMPENAQIDDDLFDKINEAMLIRLKDKFSNVRIQAVLALSRLQDPKDENCPVVNIYNTLLENDSNSEVRRAVLSCIAPSARTLPKIVGRTMDVKEAVRKLAYEVLAEKVPVRVLSIAQRVKLLQQGLNDRCDSVKEVMKKLLQAWLQSAEGNVLELLHRLDVEHCPEVAIQALNTIFSSSPLHDFVQNCTNLDSRKLIPLEDLTPENVLYWRCLCEYLKLKGEEGEDLLEQILPEPAIYADYLLSYLQNMPVLSQEQREDFTCFENLMTKEFIGQQLILIIDCMDTTEEGGRRHLLVTLQKILILPTTSTALISLLAEKLLGVIKDDDRRIQIIAEIISEVREPMITVNQPVDAAEIRKRELKLAEIKVKLNEAKEALEQCVALQDFNRASVLKEQITELEHTKNDLIKAAEEPEIKETRVEKNDPETLLNCLIMCYELLKIMSLSKGIGPTINELTESLILPGITTVHPAVRNMAVLCLGCCALQSKEFAQKHLALLLQILQIDNIKVKLSALKAIFDQLMLFGIEPFKGRRGNDSQSEDAHIRTENCEEDSEEIEEEEDTATIHNLLQLLSGFLDSEFSELRTEAAEGVAKLMFFGRLISAKLLSHLVLLWYNPVTEDDTRLRHCLGVFFPLFAYANRFNQECFEAAYLPTLQTLLNAPVTSPLSEIDISNVSELLVDLTRPSGLKPHSKKSQDYQDLTVHDSLAVKICSEILKDPTAPGVRIYAKALNSLELSSSSTENLLVLLNEILEKVKDKLCQRAIEKIKMNLTKDPNVGKDHSDRTAETGLSARSQETDITVSENTIHNEEGSNKDAFHTPVKEVKSKATAKLKSTRTKAGKGQQKAAADGRSVRRRKTSTTVKSSSESGDEVPESVPMSSSRPSRRAKTVALEKTRMNLSRLLSRESESESDQ
ncbi:condensin complex subunit 3 [Patagioenas fasciata monilis]|uniref:Condensin complex subunit 3 n=1 Tax=Patagioenas fasciata monilis TaxID=372326 RepID=A0A1V4JFH5_PATFA|nr:condensin complex subunit 3 [Patagioenas fasciata monilis]